MKVRDFIAQEICVDVYDDVCEELSIAFDGPMHLTPAGEKEWSDVLDYDIKLHDNGADIVGIVSVDDADGVWEKKLERAIGFFEAMAGWCPCDDWDLWFKEVG